MLNTPTLIVILEKCYQDIPFVARFSREDCKGNMCVIQRHHMFQLPSCSSKHQEQQTLLIILLMLQVIQSLAQDQPSRTELGLRT